MSWKVTLVLGVLGSLIAAVIWSAISDLSSREKSDPSVSAPASPSPEKSSPYVPTLALSPSPSGTTITTPEAQSVPANYLSDLEVVEQSGNNYDPKNGVVTISGQDYYRSIEFQNGFCRDRWSFDYGLGRKYTRFTSKAGLPDDGRSDSPMLLAVYVDGNKVFEEELTLGDIKDLQYSLDNALRIRFEFVRLNRKWCTSVALGDPQVASD